MRLFIGAALCSCFFFCLSSFCPPPDRLPEKNSLLWKVSGKQLAKPSYVFGTMHLICPDDYVWNWKMQKSLMSCEKVCLEMDMDDPKVLMKVTTGLTDKTGKKLKEYFTPDDYRILAKYVKDSLEMDIAFFERMKPIALQSLISSTGIACPNALSYEDSLVRMAHHHNMEVTGLEDPMEQIAVLESIPIDTIISQLMTQIRTQNKNDSDYILLTNAYKAQNIKKLYMLITASKDLGDMGIFLDGRNKKWIPRMVDQMESASTFFAVGAGHLWGESGIINLLRKSGYDVVAEM